MDVFNKQMEKGNFTDRGARRVYVPLPFMQPFADPEIYGNPDVLEVVKRLLKTDDYVMSQLATDTPMKGSDYQLFHGDTGHTSKARPESDPETPFQLAVNFSLVDVTKKNGPLEVLPGTRTLTLPQRKEYIRNMLQGNGVRPKQVLLKAGDVLIRDVRTIHRGTPNTTDEPRPMVVIGYNPRWHDRDALEGVSVKMLDAEKAKVPPHLQAMLGDNPSYPTIDDMPKEKYGPAQLEFLREMAMQNGYTEQQQLEASKKK